ncbi:hypothetical protein VTK56DRAFT_4551 [Thermocarpiscus australiensis]
MVCQLLCNYTKTPRVRKIKRGHGRKLAGPSSSGFGPFSPLSPPKLLINKRAASVSATHRGPIPYLAIRSHLLSGPPAWRLYAGSAGKSRPPMTKDSIYTNLKSTKRRLSSLISRSRRAQERGRLCNTRLLERTLASTIQFSPRHLSNQKMEGMPPFSGIQAWQARLENLKIVANIEREKNFLQALAAFGHNSSLRHVSPRQRREFSGLFGSSRCWRMGMLQAIHL